VDLGLSGRTAVVTGASRGIGLAVVRALVAEGVGVVAGARHTSPELAGLSGVRAVEVDLTRPDGPAALVAEAGGAVDILVNNVGGAPTRLDGFTAITDDMWRHTWELNLMSTVRATRAVVPTMIAAGRGAIVTISSVNSTLADPAVLDYCVAKSAIASLCKALSRELGGSGVRVNTVSPGPVSTDLWLGDSGVAHSVANASGSTPAEVVDQASRQMPTGRFTTPEEVATAVLWLASDLSGNTTGADLRIDGGLVQTW
jgi:NAD(P)-dependent dehydrogenase (short-subunit alcohol dehydrogenase family)